MDHTFNLKDRLHIFLKCCKILRNIRIFLGHLTTQNWDRSLEHISTFIHHIFRICCMIDRPHLSDGILRDKHIYRSAKLGLLRIEKYMLDIFKSKLDLSCIGRIDPEYCKNLPHRHIFHSFYQIFPKFHSLECIFLNWEGKHVDKDNSYKLHLSDCKEVNINNIGCCMNNIQNLHRKKGGKISKKCHRFH